MTEKEQALINERAVQVLERALCMAKEGVLIAMSIQYAEEEGLHVGCAAYDSLDVIEMLEMHAEDLLKGEVTEIQ